MSKTPASSNTAASFVNTLGVNTHLSYGDTAYANSKNVLSDVAYLGFTKVRDHTPSLDAATLAPYALLAAHGISFDLDAPAGAVDPKAFISQLKGFVAKLPGALAAIEGANDTNIEPVTYNGLTGMPAAAALQQAIYAAAKADGQLAAIPVYNTTLGGGSQAQYSELGNLSNACDFGNGHIYPSGGPIPSDYIAANIPWQTHGTPGKATVITEGGYFTMPGVTSWQGVNQDVQARYTLDYVLDAAAQGVPATYLYELLDERPDPNNADREQHFGLFNNHGTPKQAATALHNLTSILADPGNQAATGDGIAYTVANMPASGHTMQLVKASGASELIVWAEPNLWNQETGTTITAPVSNVVVNLGSVMQSVQVLDPLLGTAAIAQLSNVSSVNLAVTDHPLIVEVKPNVATPVVPPVATSGSLALHLSEDAWQGDAQFTLTIDGRQVSAPAVVTTLQSAGKMQDFTFARAFGAGAHRVGVSFVNDAWGGTAATDRNLYVGGIDINGTQVGGGVTTLLANGTQQFSTNTVT